MPSSLPIFILRVPEELLKIEFALTRYVAEYEKEYGQIKAKGAD